MLNWRRERDLFFLALAFLTRIPIPAGTPYSSANFNASARYFPLVGAIVGGIGALVFWLSHWLWPTTIAIALSMAATILLTGAFHEDGFADSCDGFGGGGQREQVLAIMKDSRIGTYAAIGLIIILALKFFCLFSLATPATIVSALIFAHAFSRLLSVSYLFDFDYARDDDTSKFKPMPIRMSRDELFIACLSIMPLLFLVELKRICFIFAVLALGRWAFAKYMRRRLGGYTGDCLGCAQQIAEVSIYLALGAGLANGL